MAKLDQTVSSIQVETIKKMSADLVAKIRTRGRSIPEAE